MLTEYLGTAVGMAEYKRLEDATWFAEIPGFRGVWASADSVEDCRRELIEVLEEWILLKIRDHEEVPAIEGIDINVRPVAT